MSDELAGRVALVTGAGSGIGAAVGRALAARGARLALCDLEPPAAGGDALALAADVRREADLQRAVGRCVAELGGLHAVVACAGRGDASGLEDGDPEHWREVLETNVLGTMLTLRAALPHLRREGGHAVLLSSVSGRTSYAGESAYIASKWAVEGLARALRLELAGSGVRVTTVAPGLVDTPLARGNPFAREWLARFAALSAEDVADAVVFALTRPRHVVLNELVLRPEGQEV